jgi:hypothetical protein
MKRHDIPTAVGQNKQIAAGKFPERRGAILDGSFIMGGHQGAKIGEIRQEIGGVAQGDYFLALKTLERADRVLQVGKNLLPYLRAHTLTDQKQAQGGQSGRDQNHGKQKLGL